MKSPIFGNLFDQNNSCLNVAMLSSMSSRILQTIVVGISLLLLGAPAHAVTINFDSIVLGPSFPNNIAPISNEFAGDGIIFSAEGDCCDHRPIVIATTVMSGPNAMFNQSRHGETVSIRMDFLNPVNNLTFWTAAVNAIVTVEITHAGGMDTVTNLVPILNTTPGFSDLSPFSMITSVLLTPGIQNPTFLGPDLFFLDDISFGPATAAIPLPTALPLFGTGLGLLGFLGWRRRRKLAKAV